MWVSSPAQFYLILVLRPVGLGTRGALVLKPKGCEGVVGSLWSEENEVRMGKNEMKIMKSRERYWEVMKCNLKENEEEGEKKETIDRDDWFIISTMQNEAIKAKFNTYLEALTTSLLVTGCVCERSWTLLRRRSTAAFRERGLGTPPSDVLSSSCRNMSEK